MANEVFYLVILLFEFALIVFAMRMGRDYLLSALVLNMVLSTVLAGQIIQLFSFLIATSTVFYASIFIITAIVSERYGLKCAVRAAAIGLFALVVLHLLTLLSSNFNDVLAFSEVVTSFKVVAGSLIAYYVGQKINVHFFELVRQRTKGKHLWLRYTSSTTLGQWIDSLIFYPIAFFGDVTLKVLLAITLTGWIAKTIVSALGTFLPYLFANRKGKYDN